MLPRLGLPICLASILCLLGCDSVERATPKPEPARAQTLFEIKADQIMRGTVASEAIIRGYEPTVVRGYGLVVGLAGTGSRDIPPNLRAHMIQEMARRGMGSERYGFGDLKPEAVLNSYDTAVVIVEAVIPPGAIEGTKFDVRVYADPRTGTESLEGGQLYTTELHPGPLRTGSLEARELATARGSIFINPFAEPGNSDEVFDRLSGRILDGGTVTEDMTLKLQLATPSHTRASILQNAINTRFPQEPGQPDPTARGESGESIEVTVPPSFRDRTAEFVELLRHTTIRTSGAEAVALNIKRLLTANPTQENARAASLRWQALGRKSLPIIADLYDAPDETPRLAALRAGAKLNDGLVLPHLIDLAHNGSADARLPAIELLAGIRINPMIDQALRELLSDSDIDVRLAAYEALVKRGDPQLERYWVDDRFVLDIVESDVPMIYITQIGQPRIVLFGKDLSIRAPVTMRTWSNRLMIKSDESNAPLEVYYREPQALEGMISQVDPDLPEFIQFLGHRMTVEQPEPGIGLSYGETVGALHQIWRQGYIDADFKAEQDRVLAAILDQERGSTVEARPEFSDTSEDWPEEAQFAPLSSDTQSQVPAATEPQ